MTDYNTETDPRQRIVRITGGDVNSFDSVAALTRLIVGVMLIAAILLGAEKIANAILKAATCGG